MNPHRQKPIRVAQSLTLDKQENPYVEISDSIYLLARFCIGTYLLFLVLFTFGGQDVAPYPLPRVLAFSIYVIITTIPLWARIKNMGLFHPLYILSAMHFVQAIIPSIGLAVNGIVFHPALPTKSGGQISFLHIKVILVTTLAWSCMYTGFAMSQGIKWNFIRFTKKKGTILIAGIAGMIVGLTCLYLLMDLSGGVWAHLKNINVGIRGKVWVKDIQYIGIYSNLIRLTSLAPAFWILVGKRPFSNPLFWVLAFVAIASSFMVNGRRSTILMVVVILVACWILRRGSLAIGRMVIIGFLLFLSVGIVGEFRRSNWGRQKNVRFDSVMSQDMHSVVKLSMNELEARRGGSALFPIIERVPSRVPYRYGNIYFSYLYRFIPRAIWKDKPTGGIGHECAGIFYGQWGSGGIPPSGIGEAYWSFGILGVIGVYMIWGMVLRSIGSFFVKFRHVALANVLYLATITKLGPSETNFRAWLYLVGPAVFLLICLGAMKFSSGRK